MIHPAEASPLTATDLVLFTANAIASLTAPHRSSRPKPKQLPISAIIAEPRPQAIGRTPIAAPSPQLRPVAAARTVSRQ